MGRGAADEWTPAAFAERRLTSVHERGECAGDSCVIHNPSDHHMSDWPWCWRSDRGLFERICPHGVGHPDPDQPLDSGRGVHSCDGCCVEAHGE